MNPRFDSRYHSHAAGIAAALILTCCTLPTSSFAQGTPSPQLIPFQGRLTNQAGVAYDNGQYTITLNLYSLAIGGSTVWTERHEKVSVIGGMLNLFLGSISPFDKGTPTLTDDVDFSTTKYLGITVDADNNPSTADPEMVPRTMIVAAFYAKNTQKLAGNDWSSFVVDSLGSASNNPTTGYLNGSKLLPTSVNTAQIAINAVKTNQIADGSVTTNKLAAGVGVPVGTILPFGGTVAPVGYLLCDGTQYSKATYSALSAVLNNAFGGDANNFRVPDLRGRFLRGWDNGTGRDPDAGARVAMNPGGPGGNNIGSVQGYATARPTTSFTTSFSGDHQHGLELYSATPRVANRVSVIGNTNGAPVETALTTPAGNHSHTVNGGGDSESRPVNTYVNYIIKL
jgi:microcystin-dependent protein